MRWKIRHFIFCEETQTLVSPEATSQLEPLACQVLSYFCQHPNETISRDQLIDTVWQMKAVTDNTVNRIIAKLRKEFDDDPKHPTYITTIPKKGYRFIAPAERFDEAIDPTDTPAITDRPRSPAFKTIMVALLLIIIGVASVLYFNTSPQSHPYKIEALTRGGGQELQPAVSPDGNYLVYFSFVEDQLKLFLKDLTTQETRLISSDEGHSGPANWSDDGKYLIYLYTDKSRCELHRLKIDHLDIIDKKIVHNCPLNSYGKAAFTHDNNRIIYAETSGEKPVYSLFELNLSTSSKRRLPQPDLLMGGNKRFDLHPTKNQLLISSQDEQQWLAFYSLDLDTDKLSFLFKVNEWVCCGIWSHKGDRVVTIGSHPAQELISYDLEGRDREVIFQAPHRVDAPARIGLESDYIYVGGILNRNIMAYSLTNSTKHILVNSSVDDRLAVISPDNKVLAYMSDRSGKDELWLHNIQSSSDIKITNLNSHHYYQDLVWSPDGRSIVALSKNELHIIETKSGQLKKLKIPQTEIRGVSWKSSSIFAYSVQQGDQWQVKYYDVSNDTVRHANEPWQYIRFALVPEDTLWFSHTGEIFYGPQKKPLQLSGFRATFMGRHNFIKHGEKVYYYKRQGQQWHLYEVALKSTDGGLAKTTALITTDNFGGISIGNNVIYYSPVTSSTADVFKAARH